MITGPCYRCKGTGCIEYPALTSALDAVSPTVWATTAELAEETGLTAFHVAEQLRELHRRGLLDRRGKGTRGSPYEWRRLP